jgi:hypothetical protein
VIPITAHTVMQPTEGQSERTAMSMTGQIREVHAELGHVLDHPQSFGLGLKVPQPLEDRLKWMRRMLEEALQEKEQDSPPADEDLAIELSQDADQDVL